MATSEEIARRDSDRFRVLEAIYDETAGHPLHFVRFFDVATRVGIPETELRDVLSYLTRSGLLEHRGAGGGASITARGAAVVEAKHRAPTEPAARLSQPRTIHVNGNVGSIQNGSHNVATIVQNVGAHPAELVTLLAELRAAAQDVEPTKRKRFDAAVKTFEKNATAAEPDTDAVELAGGFVEDALSASPTHAATLAAVQSLLPTICRGVNR